jgi:hypothetical protein
MIETITGSLTIIDINEANASFFWNGLQLHHVTAAAAIRKPNGDRRVSLTVIDPAHVTPALDPAEQALLNDVYNAMTATGIIIQRARHQP